MKTKITILFLFMLAFTNLQAGHSKMYKHRQSETFENLTVEERKKATDLQVELVQKESELNREIRKIRMTINQCSRKKEIDMDEYYSLKEEARILSETREQLRREYREKISNIEKNN